MPNFCRHGRLLANCPICSRGDAPAKPARTTRAPRPAARSGTPRKRATSGLRVRHVERAPDDGYDHELVQGLRASTDAARLADELAFSEARLAELTADPPGLYAEAARAGGDEGCELLFLVAYLGPGRGPDAFAAIEQARATGELDVPLGPRTSHDPARGSATRDGWQAWTARHGGRHAALLGDAAWEPERRFARVFERLTVPGLGRGARFEILLSAGAVGMVPATAGTMGFSADGGDPVVAAAKRVFGIGDAITLERRAHDLAVAAGVPVGALDLALFNWAAAGEEQRATMGARTAADPARRAQIAAALGVS